MEFDYCSRWFRAEAVPIEPLAEDIARGKHESRSPYTATFNNPVSAILDFSGDLVAVGHLDDYGREYLMYHFEEIEYGQLFLNMAVHRDFESKGNQLLESTMYHFKPTGEVRIERLNGLTQETVTQDSAIDISGNWEPYPCFGDYQGLLNKDRS